MKRENCSDCGLPHELSGETVVRTEVARSIRLIRGVQTRSSWVCQGWN